MTFDSMFAIFGSVVGSFRDLDRAREVAVFVNLCHYFLRFAAFVFRLGRA